MCLERITKLDFDPEEEVTAYKVFLDTWGKNVLFGIYYAKARLPLNKWLDERNYRAFCFEEVEYLSTYPYNSKTKYYPCGFHALCSYESAKDYLNLVASKEDQHLYKIKKVKLRKIVAEGTQFSETCKVIVAKEMFITDEEV